MKIKLSIIFISLNLINISPVFAETNIDFINNVEKTLFISNYKNENIPKRLNRIELNVYGQVNSNLSEIQRINEIKKVFPSLIVYSKPKSKIQQIPQKKPILIADKIKKIQSNPVTVNSEKYPVLDAMEKKVFNKSYANETIYVRLDRLESKVFNSKSNAGLIDRVENLKAAVMPPNDIYGDQPGGNSSDGKALSVDKTADAKKLLDALETAEFGFTYNQDNIENRISRLETKIFNAVSSEDPTLDRLERLVAVQQAQPSSKDINQQAGTLPQKAFANRVSQIGTLLFILLSLIL